MRDALTLVLDRRIRPRSRISVGLVAALVIAATPAVRAQGQSVPARPTAASGSDSGSVSQAPAKVDVKPVARDEEIRGRLQRVLVATRWYTNPQVRVDEGVVFLQGTTQTEQRRKWAGDLAQNTQDVVAVVNRITVTEPSIWDLGPASRSLAGIWNSFLRWLPWLAFGAIILVFSLVASLLALRVTHRVLDTRIEARLLRTVIARAAATVIFLVGVYLILRVMGLTQLALTVVGGTGLLGLALGIAFRDITENFLASIFLSVQRPFEPADLIEVAGVTGYVQQLNMRTTVLMNLDGNLVQIPNAAVYKANIRNYSTNPNRRAVVEVGIGYDDAISAAQELALGVLKEHPAVLDDPAPMVLVDSLGASAVILRIYFWFDGSRNDVLKVRSSVLRLVKREFQQRGISIPDGDREVIFPRGVPVTLVDGNGTPAAPAKAAVAAAAARHPAAAAPASTPEDEVDVVATNAEGDLGTEAPAIEEQARRATPKMEGANLLTPERDDDVRPAGAVPPRAAK
jgi:small-conductance mechanosensitive channel